MSTTQPLGFPALPSDWVSEPEKFKSSCGKIDLFGVLHHKKDWKGGPVLFVSHGLGEHGGRYLHFPHYLKDKVNAVYCYDHRGHGQSGGLRGHVDRFDRFSDDVSLAIRRLDERLKKQFGKPELHAFAHSMGGLIMLRALFLNHDLPVISAAISEPLLGIKAKVPAHKKYPAYVLSKILPILQMDSVVDATQLSHDVNVQRAYLADPLVHPKVTPRFFTELQWAMADTISRRKGIKPPISFFIPLADPLVDPQPAVAFFEMLEHPKKKIHTYAGFLHEAFNEGDPLNAAITKDKPLADLNAWLGANHV